jgi:hypothetical protein
MNKYRTLLRVTKKENDWFEIVIPAWDYEKPIACSSTLLPDNIWNRIKVGTRFYCYLNLDALYVEELEFERFEID